LIHPFLRELFDELAQQPAFLEAVQAIRHGEPANISIRGTSLTAQAVLAVLLQRAVDRPVLVIAPDSPSVDVLLTAAEAVDDLLGPQTKRVGPLALPSHDVTPFDGLSPHADVSEKRGIALWRLAHGSASVVVAPLAAALLKTAAPDFVRNLAWSIGIGDEFFLEDLEGGLASVGYLRHEPVEMAGQFSIRGGIFDVFSPESEAPVRIEMAGDEVESIREFDPETQKSLRPVRSAVILPVSEYPVSSEAGADELLILKPGWEFSAAIARKRQSTVLDMNERAVVLWCEPQLIQPEAGKRWDRLRAKSGRDDQLDPSEFYLELDDLRARAGGSDQVSFEHLGSGGDGGVRELRTSRMPRFQGVISHAMQELKARVAEKNRVLVAGASLGDVERLADIFTEYGIPYHLLLGDQARQLSPYLQERASLAGSGHGALIVRSALTEGVAFPDAGIILYGAEDVFAASELVARPEKRKSVASTFLSDLEDLAVGDLVVHAEHGVGRYQGMTTISQGSRQEDLMVIEYAERAKLYVPLSRLDLIQKHHGSGGRQPGLDRMGGQTWTRTKSKIKARLVDMADELLKLYAQRRMAEGFSFSPDGEFQREFEDSFKHTPTKDQRQAVNDVKRDMEASTAMDRLICGDVGFGKTEVAMRAAFKALGDDKQVAVLAPTTVLSFQHFETFKQRFASFPVTVEMLNRFRSASEQKEILERVAAGRVDILIGTHRILSKDVEFADLGLLIVDEEQRFGVRHKERLKQIQKNVDVLSMSATPIPRTLHMSLVGLRDISIIQTPPKDRLAIQTVVSPFSEALIQTAIERELGRGGQIYFIHNRVESIWETAALAQKLVPSLRIGVGHGQLPEKELEKVMLKFMNHEYDMLMATTIVENGLDIPLANTILINRADNYGLSELYQLRGRVGRSDRRAYAYLLVPEDKELTDIARKRLAALKEFSELGSGFKIAALDLELRGAGNLLGAEQSGQIGAVGFETYCRLLEETVRELRGEEVEAEVRTNLRLQIDIHIPPDYIADEAQRLRAYKQLAGIASAEDRESAAAALADRYGPLPEAVVNLMDYAMLKSLAERLRVEGIERRQTRISLRFREDSKINPERLMRYVASTPGVSFSPAGEMQWSGAPMDGPQLLHALRELLGRIAA
jgi:transcription-repair coupling factor (superfamily II helicase)